MQKKNVKYSAEKMKSRKKKPLGKKEKRRLTQLVICVVLFAAIFVGKGLSPEGVFQSGDDLLEMIQTDTDFKKVFISVKEAATGEDSVWKHIRQFLNNTAESEADTSSRGEEGPAVQMTKLSLRQIPTHKTMLAQMGLKAEEIRQPEPEVTPEPTPEPTPTPNPQPSPSPSPKVEPYTGPALPAGATMEYYDLGLGETVTPVLGRLTSAYGYRDHPISGEYIFHAGVDLSANMGTPIKAFAGGTVDFVGRSDSYGLYIQLNHGNGITSFYCHCSELCAQKGDKIEIGQVVAKTGDTGNTTGPHLHMEMKKDGVLINPLYYIKVIQ